MGNANGREDGGASDDGSGSGDSAMANTRGRVGSNDSVPNNVNVNVSGGGGGTNNNSSFLAPHSPARSTSPLLFAPQIPLAPLQNADGPPFFNQMWQNESHGVAENPPEPGIPTVIIWNHGGNEVVVEGSWDNWTSRKQLLRSGKDHSILLVLPSGIYHYKFIVDGEWRYIPEFPYVADEMGRICNVLDVHDYVPENLDNVTEFEAPVSPESSYSQAFPTEEDFAKEPVVVPPQLHLTVLGMENPDEASFSRPQHVVLNHLFIEKGWASQSLVALGLTHRFQSKYVTVVLYKPLKR